ncbi:hypothetical protein EU528_01220 [Candidatus Thorarchaeota archaeon]|nr:MAG: hypothetical protein EU528_01220 [Candidatus Thorarchaeota archaeon]
MRESKKTKSIDDLSVSKLLDDFVDLSAEEESKRARELDDEEYIRMMIEKEESRKKERIKKIPAASTHNEVHPTQEKIIERATLQLDEQELETFPLTCERDLSPEETAIIEEIMKTQDMMDEAAQTGRKKISPEVPQNEISPREARRKARETLAKHRKDTPTSEKKRDTPVVSEKRAPIKRCQTCYFCVKERKVGGACWCSCSNPGRSTHAVVRGSWVMSRMNLPCWKAQQD